MAKHKPMDEPLALCDSSMSSAAAVWRSVELEILTFPDPTEFGRCDFVSAEAFAHPHI